MTDREASAQRERMAEQREFWRGMNFAPLTIPVPPEAKAELTALAQVKVGEHLTNLAKTAINEPDLEPFRHRKHLRVPNFVEVAEVRVKLGKLRSVPAWLRKRYDEFETLFTELVDYHRIATHGDGTDFELKQAWALRFAMSYTVNGELFLLREIINARPTKTPDRGQPEVFDTEPRAELLETGDGQNAD